eukprot:CAMPEP_0119076028 /NCGR_PEP_ID=MMETSP1178-20130426/83681_1 /TAXON_ID=33656 /ORGANISM="unid sp, Strain CCMP2000" /LENGTH=52 /DNA_ID=CAMNT_0007058289 /DNA_START=49 /DNA_END=203 /DNA_ORIENTATION=-
MAESLAPPSEVPPSHTSSAFIWSNASTSSCGPAEPPVPSHALIRQEILESVA